jgi:hypothetical protein
MEKQALSRNVDQLLDALRLCRQNQLMLPALLIAYASIDILASLDPPEPGASTRRRFVAWVDRYLLPNSELPCSAVDLFASRCAVVHTAGSQSRLERDGEARRIVYAFGHSSAEESQSSIRNLGNPSRDIAIHVETVLNAFERSVWLFRSAILQDASLRDRVRRNSSRLLPGVSFGAGFSILDIRMA